VDGDGLRLTDSRRARATSQFLGDVDDDDGLVCETVRAVRL
jgi:hypothetical protein